MKKILVLEPYFGGSHKYFLEGLQQYVEAEYTFMVLPARKWKMRMQLSAHWYVDQINALPPEKRIFDLVFCSTFVDVAVFRAMTSFIENWNHNAKILSYFHENQFGYPQQFKDRHQHQFSAINFHTALCSDGIAFNTDYNRQNFFIGCRKFLKSAADMQLSHLVEKIREKSVILYPGIDFTEIDQIAMEKKVKNEVPVIVWNHRWEHDKDPDQFFLALRHLEEKGIDFKLIVLGESYTNSPECFNEAQQRFADKIIHFGFVESYSQYIALLALGDIVVSTSRHEFYGISIIEAVRAGCRPLLPHELSYPELFGKKFLYARGSLFSKLSAEVQEYQSLEQDVMKEMTEKFSWSIMRDKFDEWFVESMGQP